MHRLRRSHTRRHRGIQHCSERFGRRRLQTGCRLKAGGLHHPLDVEPFLAHALVEIEECEPGGADGAEKGGRAERNELRQHIHADRNLAVVLEDGYKQEGLGNAADAQLDRTYEKQKYENAPPRTFAEFNGTADCRTGLQVFHHARGYSKRVAEAHPDRINESRKSQQPEYQEENTHHHNGLLLSWTGGHRGVVPGRCQVATIMEKRGNQPDIQHKDRPPGKEAGDARKPEITAEARQRARIGSADGDGLAEVNRGDRAAGGGDRSPDQQQQRNQFNPAGDVGEPLQVHQVPGLDELPQAKLHQVEDQRHAGIERKDSGKEQEIRAIELGGAVEYFAQRQRAQVGIHRESSGGCCRDTSTGTGY